MKSARFLVVLAAFGLFGCQTPATPTTSPSAPAGLPSPPPWPAPTDAAARIQAAGLEAMAAEAFTVHIHAHLSVFYNGETVVVPAGIGIGNRLISPLHSHDVTGVMHVESPKAQDFTVGQFFTEWNVPLTGAKGYVNGTEVPDAAAIVLKDHEEIAIVYGTAPATIPSSYSGRWP